MQQPLCRQHAACVAVHQLPMVNRVPSPLWLFAAHSRSLPQSQHVQTQAVSAAAAVSTPHTPVLLNEILQTFEPLNIKVYLDCTLGAGGHACAIAEAHKELELLVGIDMDPVAHSIAQSRIQELEHSSLAHHLLLGNYSDLLQLLSNVPGQLVGRVDAILMDLGVSSMQLDTADRGFSFLRDGPLDMRLGPQATTSAEEVVNTWPEAELGRIIREYGEEKMWKAVARRIVQAREAAPITTTQQLVSAIGQTFYGKQPGKRIHPATRTFQALRIAVNDEMSRLEKALPDAISCLSPGGRLAVITFHSLEDRIVKHTFLRACGKPTPADEHMTYGADKFAFLDSLQMTAVAKQVTRKPLVPCEQEMANNSRSRSAKLRVIEKL